MPFLLARGGRNIPAEVQRWQYYLLKRGFTQTGGIDGDFGAKTETATRFFQIAQDLKTTGKLDNATLAVAKTLGYTILPDDYYSKRRDPDWPKKPKGTASPTNKWRNSTFGCFLFRQLARQYRPDPESIIIDGSCDGKTDDWTRQNIVDIPIKQLEFAKGYSGYVRCHELASSHITDLFAQWEADDLLHLIIRYEGCFVPRYKRNQAPRGDAAQPERRSLDVDQLSNHSFGSAFDINYAQNQFPGQPALCGDLGSTRELVQSAAKLGFYWGGFFKDGNHFELANLNPGQ